MKTFNECHCEILSERGDTIHLLYNVIQSSIDTGEEVSDVFGISCTSNISSGEIEEKCILDISPCKDFVVALAERLCRFGATPTTIEDIICDAID